MRATLLLAAVIPVAATVPAADPPRTAGTPAQLATAAKAVFATHCYRCHGKDGADEGGFGSILDRRRLTEAKLVAPGDAAKSKLLQRVTKGEMPPPEEKVKLPAADLDTLTRWVEGGAPDWAAVVARRFIPIGLALRLPEDRDHELSLPFRMDWFLAAASRPPVYHGMADVPWTVKQLEDRLRAAAADNIRDGTVLRAGFNGSGVSRHNRIIDRHEGYYWKSYDFGGSKGRQNVFAHPLGPGPSADGDTFLHAGGEIIFRLPNGLHGYMLTDGRGNRINRGPTDIVSDPKHPEKVVENGVSCMSCHAGGLIDKADQVRPLAEPADAAFPKAVRTSILSLYAPRAKFEEAVGADTADYRTALARLGIKPGDEEPVSAAARRYEAEVDLRRAAAELWLPPDQFLAQLRRIPADLATRTGVALLLAPGGSVKRDTFVAAFGVLVRLCRPDVTYQGPIVSRDRTTAATRTVTPEPGDPFRLGARTVTGHKVRPVIDPAFRLVAVTPENDGCGELRDLATSEVRHTLRPGPSRAVVRAVFSPDGSLLAFSDSSGSVRFWDTRTGEPLGVTTEPKKRPVGQQPPQFRSLAFSSDGKELVTLAGDGVVRCFDPASGKQLRTLGRGATSTTGRMCSTRATADTCCTMTPGGWWRRTPRRTRSGT